jgi:hypothetical protein
MKPAKFRRQFGTGMIPCILPLPSKGQTKAKVNRKPGEPGLLHRFGKRMPIFSATGGAEAKEPGEPAGICVRWLDQARSLTRSAPVADPVSFSR